MMKKIMTTLALMGIFLISGCVTEESEVATSTTSTLSTVSNISIPSSTAVSSTSTSTSIRSTIPIPTSTADELYKTAMKHYQSEDLINASVKAKEALDRYTEINDTEGISRCNALLSAIDKRIVPKPYDAEMYYRRASGTYKKATETGSFDDYMNAIVYAENANELFDKTGDKEGYAKSRDLLTLINSDIYRLEGEFKKKADSHWDKGMTEYLYGVGARDKNEAIDHLNNATKSLGNAKKIYYWLYTQAKEIEDYNLSERKKKLYYGEVQKCNKKLEEIDRITATCC